MFVLDFVSLGNETWELYREAKEHHDSLWQIPFPDQHESSVLIILSKGEDRLHYKIFPLPAQSSDEEENEIWSETVDEYSALRDQMLKKKIYILLGLPETSHQSAARGQNRATRKQLQMDVYTEENVLLKTVVFQSQSAHEWGEFLLTSNTVTPSTRYETPLAPFWINHINEWLKNNIKEDMVPSSEVLQAKGAMTPNSKGFGQLTMKQNGCRELSQGSKKLVLPQTQLLNNSICMGLVDSGSSNSSSALHLEAHNWFESHKLLLQERAISIAKLQVLNVLISSAVHITGKGVEKLFTQYRSHKKQTDFGESGSVAVVVKKPDVQHRVHKDPTNVRETALVAVVENKPVVRPQPVTGLEEVISAGVSLYQASSNVAVRMRTQREIQVSRDGAKTITQRDLRPAKDRKKFHDEEYLAIVGPPKGKSKAYDRMKDWYHGAISDSEARRRLESVLGGGRTRGTHLVYKSLADNQYYLLVANTTKAIYKVLIEQTEAGRYFFKLDSDQKQSASKPAASYEYINKLVPNFRGVTGNKLWVDEKVGIKLRDYATM
ncbi:MAG: hypothetical protein ACR2PX_06440 [Endozoicomonas sp.]|uniref:hypothetical protein n=1 Tax=Endozoicomonas sp. TaxID=1892382 RepID=UPI003D9B2834